MTQHTMKTLILAMALSLLIPSLSIAADWSWDRTDVLREVVSDGITVLDWGQTRDIRNHNGHTELNPVLGPTPSNAAINRYFASVMIIHPIVSALLPKTVLVWGFELKPRMSWQYIYMGVEVAAISSNFHGGLKLSF
jgi:hypothetical protein